MKMIEVFVLSHYGEFTPVKLTTDKQVVEAWLATSTGNAEGFIVSIPKDIPVQADY